MYTAKEAADLMIESVERKKLPEVNRMFTSIQRAANDGEECVVHQSDAAFPVIRAAMTILVENGYTVTVDRHPSSDVYDVKIAWRHI